VSVETAVGETCALHEIGDADAVDAALSKESGGNFKDSLAILCGLGAAYSHLVCTSGI
jgi:hypothetical protein